MRKALFVFFFIPFLGMLLIGAGEKKTNKNDVPSTTHTPTKGPTIRPAPTKALLEMHSKSLLKHEKDIGELKNGFVDLQKNIKEKVSNEAKDQVAQQIQFQNQEIQSQQSQLATSINTAEKTNIKLADTIKKYKSKPLEEQLEFWIFFAFKLFFAIATAIIIFSLFYHNIFPEPPLPPKNGNVTNISNPKKIHLKRGLWKLGGFIKIGWSPTSSDKKAKEGS